MNKTYMLKFTIYSLLSLCIIRVNNTLNLKYLAISLFIGFFASILNEILAELKKLNKR
jgi:uncharacterized membrane protein YjjP (DUF1212 family)